MLATTVICPNCSSALKTSTPVLVGKTVLCRQCGTTFEVQSDDGLKTPDAVAATNKMLIFGGVIGAAVLLMLVGTATAFAVSLMKHRAADHTVVPTETIPAAVVEAGEKSLEYCPPVKPDDDKGLVVITQTETTTGKPWLPKEEQVKVDKAIERGLAYLRSAQKPSGTWSEPGHSCGMAALPGLTLLECGAKADDPQVLRAAEFVRANFTKLTKTYELALCVLFLDRLGDPKDESCLQTMALRLIAGQKTSGGWTYDCPILSASDERDLLLVLQATRPVRLPNPAPETNRVAKAGEPGEIMVRPGEKGGTGRTATNDGSAGRIVSNDGGGRIDPKDGGGRPDPKDGGGRIDPKDGGGRPDPKDDSDARPGRSNPKDIDQPFQGAKRSSPGGDNTKDEDAKPKVPDGAAPKPNDERARHSDSPPTIDMAKLSKVVLNVPAVQPARLATEPMPLDRGFTTDNSNSQFAILAIWVSGRHDVPTEKACALIERRFRTSQGPQGNWGYNYHHSTGNVGGATPAMTAAGLLGLAVGHGAAATAPGEKSAPKEGLDDEAITKGFKFLGDHLGKSQAAAGKARIRGFGGGVGLYFLWSVERVGVMYNLRSIGDKDWYAWGSEIIGDNQREDGSWGMGFYPGSDPQVDTCFALLFLKRANLAKDLSTKIEYLIDVKGIGNRN